MSKKSKKKVASKKATKAEDKNEIKAVSKEEAADQKNTPTLNIPRLLDMVGGILHKTFLAGDQENAKKLFKKIKKDKKVPMGSINIEEKLELKLNLGLDYSEFQGPGFNFDMFKASLHSMLGHMAKVLKEQGNLNLLTNEQNMMLFNLPGVIKKDDQYNVMVTMIDPTATGEITFNLLYVDPTQYEALKEEA